MDNSLRLKSFCQTFFKKFAAGGSFSSLFLTTLLLLFLLAQEWRILPVMGGYLSVGKTILFLVIGIGLALWIGRKDLRVHGELLWPLGALALVGVISTLLSIDWAAGALTWNMKWTLRGLFRMVVEEMILFLGLCLLAQGRDQAGVYLRALLYVVIFNFLLALGMHYRIDFIFHLGKLFSDYTIYEERPFGTFPNPTVTGVVASFGVILSLYGRSNGFVPRREFISALVSSVGLFILCATRNGWVVLFCASCAYTGGLFFYGFRKKALAIASTVTLTMGLVYLLHPLTRTRMNGLFTAFFHRDWLQSTALRSEIWKAAIKAWLAHPFWGVGPASFNLHINTYSGKQLPVGEFNAHNLFLGVLSEMGLAGLAVVGFLLYAVFSPLFRATNGLDRIWVLTITVMILSSQLFDFITYSLQFAIFCTLIVTVLYSTYIKKDEN